MNYQKSVDVAKLLAGVVTGGGGVSGPAQRILSKRGSAVADSQSNIIFINDIPSKLDEIRTFIKAIDVGARQVLIEARVVEATDSFNRSIGAKLGLINSKSLNLGGGVNVVGGSYAPATGTSTITDGVLKSTITPGILTQTPVVGVNLPSFSSTGGTMAFSLFNSALTRILNVEIAALESDGLGKVISSPRVITANNVKASISGVDYAVMSAAVADYKPKNIVKGKIKKSAEENYSIETERTVDILEYCGKNKSGYILVGFALETENEIEYAKDKIKRKNLDMIVVNNPRNEGAGFMTDTNIITIIDKDLNSTPYSKMTKYEAAEKILDKLVKL